MKEKEMSVSDVWLDSNTLAQTLVERIKKCGVYSPYNEEWQSLSTMIDYALKWIKDDSDRQLILDELKRICYVPLYDISKTAAVKLGWIKTSPDGKIGVNIYQTACSDGMTTGLIYENCLTRFLTGKCIPLFSIVLKGLTTDARFSLSPDSKKIAVLSNNVLTVWGIATCEILYRKHLSRIHDNSDILWSNDSTKIILTRFERRRQSDLC